MHDVMIMCSDGATWLVATTLPHEYFCCLHWDMLMTLKQLQDRYRLFVAVGPATVCKQLAMCVCGVGSGVYPAMSVTRWSRKWQIRWQPWQPQETVNTQLSRLVNRWSSFVIMKSNRETNIWKAAMFSASGMEFISASRKDSSGFVHAVSDVGWVARRTYSL